MSPSPLDTVTLQFDKDQLSIGDADIRQGLSGVVLHGDQLWLACDEGCRLERLSRAGSSLTFSGHQVFGLDTLLTLPAKADEEADVEGLDVDGGWVWLVGSHSVKRKKPKKNDAAAEVAKKLTDVTRDGNRHLLARIPLEGSELRPAVGARRAASIKATPSSSALLRAIAPPAPAKQDPHFASFVPLPGKDNGLDIEGLAVRGMRAFVGLRGPVLREWCCVLELLLEDKGKHLGLTPLVGKAPYRKHFMKLNGLGVRDLVLLGDDLLVLAGPSMAHDGPLEIWRWKNAAKKKKGTSDAAPDVTRVLELPDGTAPTGPRDSPFSKSGDAGTSVLVVFDTPDPVRLSDPGSVTADLYRLP